MIVKDYNPNEISFSITEEAKKQLQKLFKTQTVFLLTVKKMGCSGYAYDLKQISLDELKPEFILIDPEINFYVDENYKNLLNNITMKWNDDSVFQKSFVFENPNAKIHADVEKVLQVNNLSLKHGVPMTLNILGLKDE